MGSSAPCPHCGATLGEPSERPPDQMSLAVDALYQEVARIRMIAETSADHTDEIRLLQETVARLRGSSVAAAQFGRLGHNGQNGNGQNGNGQHPARVARRTPGAASLSPGSPSSSAA